METESIPINQIGECQWEIPVGARPGMRVPGLIFADEKLIQEILKDRSLEQVANVAMLPGIVKASMAMPDIHWGYGAPIGSVAAMDPESGVIAPGLIGYDINCLTGDSRVLHRHGYSRTIGEIVTGGLRDEVLCFKLNTKESQSASVGNWLRKRPSTSVLEVTTSTGRSIVATADHPFLTPRGMKLLGSLTPGERVAVEPFEGVPYEQPSSDVLVDEQDVVQFLQGQGRVKGNAIPQVLGHLHERGLLPLRYDSPALPALIKVLGYVMGDGTLYFVRKRGVGLVWFFGKAEDLEEIRHDLSHWFTVSRTYTRRRQHRIQTDYGERQFEASNDCCKVGGTSFAVLLALLGCPVGNKSLQDYGVPPWLLRAPLWQKRLFLGAYFGAELSTPRAFTERNRNFYGPLLTVQKQMDHAESGRRFLEEFSSLVREFGVEPKGIDERLERVERRHGRSIRLRLSFSSRPESLVALWAKIGFEYNCRKRVEAAAAVSYLRFKQVLCRERQAAVAEIARLRETIGLTASRIAARIEVATVNPRVGLNRGFIQGTVQGGGSRVVRVPEGFPTYDEFRGIVTKDLAGSGLVWEEVEEIRPRVDVEWVYDITVDHPDHNFVANGFVVHNCGVRLIRTKLTEEEVRPVLRQLVAQLFRDVPCGVGVGGDIKFSKEQERKILTEGAQWIVKQGYGVPQDVQHTEGQGKLEDADPDAVSARAYERGGKQVGTLGSGNHFVEVQVVDRVFNPEAANLFGLREGSVTVMIHSGSRGFGYQVCDDHLEIAGKAGARYGISLPDRQLACVPIRSPEGAAYLGAMRCAANYAWANRQLLMHRARGAFERAFGRSWQDLGMSLIYDVAHNIAKMERYTIDGKERLLLVQRKGATRAFPPGHPELPEEYRPYGQPVIIPGDMGRNSYLLLGAAGSIEHSFGSSCHGAGRRMSRTAAVRASRGRNIRQELEEKGIIAMGRGRNALEEEQPDAYKDVNEVVEVVERAGISKRVCRMRPIGVIKG